MTITICTECGKQSTRSLLTRHGSICDRKGSYERFMTDNEYEAFATKPAFAKWAYAKA